MASEERTENYNDDLKRMAEKLGTTPPPPQAIETPTGETSQINQILSGWGNRIKDAFGVLDAETKELSRLRLLHCNSCYMRTSNTCDPRKSMTNNITGETVKGCGCNIAAKSMSPTSLCPLGKWDK